MNDIDISLFDVQALFVPLDPAVNLVDVVAGEDRVIVMLMLRVRERRQGPWVQHEPERLPCLLEKLTGKFEVKY